MRALAIVVLLAACGPKRPPNAVDADDAIVLIKTNVSDANVFVDGVKTHVDLFSSSLTERRVVFVASGLSAGQHTIRIKVKGTSGRPRVDIDGILVLAP